MNEDHSHLNNLLFSLKGLEASLQQMEGLVKNAAEQGNVQKHDQYQRELTRLLSNRRDLMRRIQ